MKKLRKVLSLLLVGAIMVTALMCGTISVSATGTYRDHTFNVVKTNGYVGFMLEVDNSLVDKYYELYKAGKSPLYYIGVKIFDYKFNYGGKYGNIYCGCDYLGNFADSDYFNTSYRSSDNTYIVSYLWKDTSTIGKELLSHTGLLSYTCERYLYADNVSYYGSLSELINGFGTLRELTQSELVDIGLAEESKAESGYITKEVEFKALTKDGYTGFMVDIPRNVINEYDSYRYSYNDTKLNINYKISNCGKNEYEFGLGGEQNGAGYYFLYTNGSKKGQAVNDAKIDFDIDKSNYRIYIWIKNDSPSAPVFSGKVKVTYNYYLKSNRMIYWGDKEQHTLSVSSEKYNDNQSIEKPASTTLTAKKTNGKYKLSWKAVSGITKYQIQYSTDGGKTYKSAGKAAASKTSVTLKLDTSKSYTFRIRSYKTVDGKKYYSNWSDAVTVK